MQAEAGGGEVLYGLDKELAEKAAAKYDANADFACRMWIEAVTGEKLGESTLQEELKNGLVLCNLINCIKPGLVGKPSTSKMPFKQMENISMYLDGCTKLGGATAPHARPLPQDPHPPTNTLPPPFHPLAPPTPPPVAPLLLTRLPLRSRVAVPSYSSFQTVALYENKDMIAVINNIQALGSAAQKAGYQGPVLGAKIATAAPREFDEATLRKGSTMQTFLGKGSQGHASQAGMGVGNGAEIVKCNTVASATPSKACLGSSGCASQAGMVDTSRNIVRDAGTGGGRSSGAVPSAAPTGLMAGSTGMANQSNMCRKGPASQGTGGAVFSRFEDKADESGGVNYGLDADLAAKAAAKYDMGLEAEVRAWIEGVTGEKLGECTLQEELKNGIVLCSLINGIWPGMCPKPSTSKMPFKQMENISNYLAATTQVGVKENELFQTVALFENKDMMAVLINIQSLGRQAQAAGYQGPALGAKLATANKRNFTEEQLAAGLNTATFLGKGSHGGATQSGMIDRSKEINRTGHVSGIGHLGSADPTFLGTGSHGGATQAGMHSHKEIVQRMG